MKTRQIFNQLASLIIGFWMMTIFTSCNDHHVKSGAGIEKKTLEELTIDGNYEVAFLPLNSSVSGITNAKASIRIIADTMMVSLEVKDSPALTIHPQYVYNSHVCPEEVHDTNFDGFIDSSEAAKVLNEILIPLDGDLNSQEDGMEYFPIADTLGNYKYSQEGYLPELISDLHLPDLNLKDGLTKLASHQNLKLEGKAVVILGIQEEVYLPGSIRNIGTNSDRSSLPIACGIIKRKLLPESDSIGVEEQLDISF